MTPRDDLALFSAQELAAGLTRLTTRENAEEMARLVGAIPASERRYYRWSHEAVLLVSSVEPEIAERVRRYYGRDDETRALIAAQQEHTGRLLAEVGERHGDTRYRLQNVIIDVRPEAPANMAAAYLPPHPRAKQRTVLDLASEDELTAALALRTSDEGAREVAAAVCAIPPEEQVHYEWIHETLMLLSCVSDGLAERVRARLTVTPEEREEFARRQRSFAEYLRSRGGRREGSFDLEDVIFDVRLDPYAAPQS